MGPGGQNHDAGGEGVIMSTKCGPGSTRANTVNLRVFLKSIVEDYDVHSVLDLGCGDLYWITLDPWEFSYLGLDDNIRLEAKQRADERAWELQSSDIRSYVEETDQDLAICKDVMRHHDKDDIGKIISNLRTKYLLCDYDEKTVIQQSWHRLHPDVPVTGTDDTAVPDNIQGAYHTQNGCLDSDGHGRSRITLFSVTNYSGG